MQGVSARARYPAATHAHALSWRAVVEGHASLVRGVLLPSLCLLHLSIAAVRWPKCPSSPFAHKHTG